MESFFSSKILITIIRQNQRCKDILLEIPYDIKIGSPSISFFHCLIKNCIQAIKSKSNENIIIGLLRLLCEWISGSSESALRFIENTNDFLFFIELLNNSKEKNPHIQGLSALLVGLISLELKDDEKLNPGLFSKETIFNSIMTKVGIKNLEEKWNELMKDPQFIQAEKEKNSKFKEIYDLEFTQFMKDSIQKISTFLTNFEKKIQEIIEKEKEIKNSKIEQENKRKENEILIEKLKEENSNLKKQISHDIKMNKEEKIELENLNSKLTLDIKEMTNKFNQSEKSRNEQLKEFQIRTSLLEAQVLTLNKQKEQDIEVLRNSSLLQIQIEENLKGKEKEIEILKHQMSKMNKSEEVEKLKKEIEIQKEEIRELLNNETSFDNERKRMMEIYQNVKEELKEKNQEIERMKLNISTIQESYESKIQQMIKRHQEELLLEATKNNKINELHQLSQQLKVSQDFNEKLKAESSLLSSRIQILEMEIAKKDKQIKEIEQDNEDMMDIIEKLEEKLKIVKE